MSKKRQCILLAVFLTLTFSACSPDTPPTQESNTGDAAETEDIATSEPTTGSVTGPALWEYTPGKRITLCEVSTGQRPGSPPIDCIVHADLTGTLGEDGGFQIDDVPPGWYLILFEHPDADYDSFLSEYDGQTIAAGDPNVFPSESMTIPAGCPIDQMMSCAAYMWTIWADPAAPVQLATNISLDISRGGLTPVLAHVAIGESFTIVYSNDLPVTIDSDNDGALDTADNCPSEANADQDDGDQDGVGDACDLCPDSAGSAEGCPDADSDGIADSDDNCPSEANIGQLDFNQDGIGDACQDSDEDSLTDAEDFCPEDAGQVETNGCPDTDGDGLIDVTDICPQIAGSPENLGCETTPNYALLTPDNWSQAREITAYGTYSTPAFALSPDNLKVMTREGIINVWDLLSGELITTFDGTWNSPSYEFNGDGTVILEHRPANAVTWNAATGEQLATLYGGNNFIPIPGRSEILSVSYEIHLWDAFTGADLFAIKTQNTQVTRSHDSSFLAIETESPPALQILNTKTRGLKTLTDVDMDQLNHFQFSDDETLFAAGFADGSIRIWDTSTWQEVALIQTEYAFPQGFSFSPDHSQMAIINADYGNGLYQLSIWSYPSGEKLLDLDEQIDTIGYAVFIGEEMLYCWSNEQDIIVDTKDGTILKSLGDGSLIYDDPANPNRELLIYTNADQSQVEIWDGKTLEPVNNPMIPNIESALFTDDHRFILLQYADGIVHLWGVPIPPQD